MGTEQGDPDGAVGTGRDTARSATRGERQRRHCPVAGDARQLITAGLGDPDAPATVRGDAVEAKLAGADLDLPHRESPVHGLGATRKAPDDPARVDREPELAIRRA